MTPDLIIRLIADVAVIPVILIGAYLLLFKVPKGKARYEAYCRILMAGLTAYLLAKLAATVYQPSDLRPFELMGVDPGALYLNNPGFPSDHALFVTAITAAVWFETRAKKTAIVLAILVLLIAIGRVVALVHTPIDVIAGIVIALLGAVWYLDKPGGQKEILHGKSSR
ncbi:MAG: phosphatase PAP2 family protein [Candidatus Microsaccharimonas sp.]|jgi:membrane-associated phospholipid phosphatase